MNNIAKNLLLLLVFVLDEVAPVNAIVYHAYYFEKNGQIYFGYDNDAVEVEGCDVETFKYKSEDKPQRLRHRCYALDKQHVFFEGKIVEGLNPETAEVCTQPESEEESSFYAKDNRSVYFEERLVELADPLSFEILPVSITHYDFARDNNYVFHQGRRIERDVASFELLDDYHSVDINGIYFKGKKIEGVDPLSYTQDKFFIFSDKKIFLNGEPLKGYHPKTFKLLRILIYTDSAGGYGYVGSIWRDKKGVYIDGVKQLNVSHPMSFDFVSDNVAADKESYYGFNFSYSLEKGGYIIEANKLYLSWRSRDTIPFVEDMEVKKQLIQQDFEMQWNDYSYVKPKQITLK